MAPRRAGLRGPKEHTRQMPTCLRLGATKTFKTGPETRLVQMKAMTTGTARAAAVPTATSLGGVERACAKELPGSSGAVANLSVVRSGTDAREH